ncbi:MAG: hypothetical protein LRZ84_14545 [Desertifilum sp.]|nr:hypothetical protein [Desertifilum sp.]
MEEFLPEILSITLVQMNPGHYVLCIEGVIVECGTVDTAMFVVSEIEVVDSYPVPT